MKESSEVYKESKINIYAVNGGEKSFNAVTWPKGLITVISIMDQLNLPNTSQRHKLVR